jgi:hypothetical protein
MATSHVQLVAIVVSLTLVVLVLELVRRRKLIEEYSLVWIVCALGLLVLSVWRRLPDRAAAVIGVVYPPSALLLAVIVIAFLALLWFSVILSRQRRQIERLMEETAILSAELRELETRGRKDG